MIKHGNHKHGIANMQSDHPKTRLHAMLIWMHSLLPAFVPLFMFYMVALLVWWQCGVTCALVHWKIYVPCMCHRAAMHQKCMGLITMDIV